MDAKAEKTHDTSSEKSAPAAQGAGFYDPSQESKWTRLGLTLESFKRAPGTTAYVFRLDLQPSLF